MGFSLWPIRYSKTARTISAFAAGNFVAMVLGVAGSLVQARYVEPEDLGVFRTFGIVTGYLTFLHLGVFDGLQREIPLQVGRGNQAKAEQMASACLSWIVCISVVGAASFLGLALQAAYCREWLHFWGWLANVPVIVGTFYGGYLGTTFRTGQQFVTLSRISVMQAVAGTLVLPLLPIMGYYGVCLRAAVNSTSSLVFLHRWQPMRMRPRLDWPSFREVLRMGLPLSGIGYVSTSLWASLEGSLMLGWFGTKVLGLYAVAVFIRAVANQLAQSLNQVMTVKVYGEYGRSHRAENCVRLLFKPMVLAVLASLPLVAVGWFVLPCTVRLLIPNYIGAVPMMRAMLLTMPITLLSMPVTILWATGRRLDCFTAVIVGFVAFAGSAHLFYKMNFGALSVLIGSILGQAINILVSYILILKLIFRERRSLDDKGAFCYRSNV